MTIGRKRIAEAVRALAAECAAGTAPELGEFFSNGCAVERVAERLGTSGYPMAMEICDYCDQSGPALCAVYKANDEAPPKARAAAVVAPLNALAAALETTP